jgi:uncharacterized protein (TIGR02246 family)
MKPSFCVVLCAGLIGSSIGAAIGGAAQEDLPKETSAAQRLRQERDAQEIEQANHEFGKAFASGNPAAVAARYTKEARLLPPNSQVVEGTQAIEQFWKGVMASGIKSVELKIVEVDPFGDTLVEQGTATLYGQDQKVLDTGKYLVVWKRVDGEWKMHRDCWNSSEPAAKP